MNTQHESGESLSPQKIRRDEPEFSTFEPFSSEWTASSPPLLDDDERKRHLMRQPLD